MKKTELENIELNLLMEAMHLRYGYDFRHYARASVERRAKQFSIRNGYNSVSEMIPLLLNNEPFFEKLVKEFSITVTELFRDPFVYNKLSEGVFTSLKTYPFIRIWHAGCATGEEVYSLAILLKEKGLYEHSRIYATDFNDEALEVARQGIYKIDNVKQYTTNYQKAGGSHSFSEYYNAKYDSVSIDKSLKKNITFANHNLVTDGIFGEMHLILCRNVLIYFDNVLQNRVLNLIHDSLVNGGFLCIGKMESLLFSDVEKKFNLIEDKEKIYQKKFLKTKSKSLDHSIVREFDAVVIGVSAGGLKALIELFSGLRNDLQIPIIVTQHLHPLEDRGLAEILNTKSRVKVVTADDNLKIVPNRIFVGPPDHHLLINENGCFSLSKEAKVNHSRPSIDLMFRSASLAFGGRIVGIILTGANDDGADGIKTIRQKGGYTIAQDPETAEFKAMPLAAIETGMVDKILNLKEIADYINNLE
jgi:chemotaxis protein methyltransferase CheR